jgi:hypothetical protein
MNPINPGLVFKFSKKVPTDHYPSDNGVKNVSGIYYIFLNDQSACTFVAGSRFSLIQFGGQTFEVEEKWGWLKSRQYLINKASGAIAAEYRFNTWLTAFRSPVYKLTTGEKSTYKFQRMPPPVKPAIFKRSTWGYYQFKLYNHYESIVYNLKMELPEISDGGYSDLSFEGTAELINTDNQFLVFAGLYLIEQYFRWEDY